MFDIFAGLLSSIPTFLFPVFASYKALKTSDPALLTPWLMYWVVLACALFVESWVGFILVWVPFYAWFRLGFLLYLILPQTQGARVLYQKHVHPILEENERAIDDFITKAHDRVRSSSLVYVQQLIELVKQYAFGIQPQVQSAPPPASAGYTSYAQSLISRFNLPAAKPQYPGGSTGGAPNTASDFFSLLAGAVSTATSSSGGSDRTRGFSDTGSLIPPHVNGPERLSFIAAQRERLTILLSALDKEASTLQQQQNVRHARVPSNHFDGSSGSEDTYGSDGLSTRKSEPDFEKIDHSGVDEFENGRRQQVKRGQSASGSWNPWSWGAKGPEGDQNPDYTESRGQSSGFSR